MTTRQTSELKPNRRAEAIQPSATLAVSARAGELRAAGKQVLNFSAGEPDFQPPAPVAAAVRELVDSSPVHYAPVAGLPALRDAAAAELSEYHGRAFSRADVMVNCGAKHSLANLFLVTLEPGDEVVILAPYWVSYPEMVRLGDGVPRVVEATLDDGWRVRPEALAAALGPKTRYVVINSPSNPTGAGYSAADLQALYDIIEAKAPQAWLVCDDIYRKLVYGDFTHASAFRALAGRTEQIILVDGVSKSHAMTGYRIGFLVAPPAIVAAASRIQGQMTSGAATPSQRAALAALRDPACVGAVESMREAFARRRELILGALATIPGVRVHPPEGAFYVFADVSRFTGEGRAHADDVALATWLLETALVATVPGSPFGAPGHLRISYATSDEALKDGLSRIRSALASLEGAS
jgi:aspartate aminotransferase